MTVLRLLALEESARFLLCSRMPNLSSKRRREGTQGCFPISTSTNSLMVAKSNCSRPSMTLTKQDSKCVYCETAVQMLSTISTSCVCSMRESKSWGLAVDISTTPSVSKWFLAKLGLCHTRTCPSLLNPISVSSMANAPSLRQSSQKPMSASLRTQSPWSWERVLTSASRCGMYSVKTSMFLQLEQKSFFAQKSALQTFTIGLLLMKRQQQASISSASSRRGSLRIMCFSTRTPCSFWQISQLSSLRTKLQRQLGIVCDTLPPINKLYSVYEWFVGNHRQACSPLIDCPSDTSIDSDDSEGATFAPTASIFITRSEMPSSSTSQQVLSWYRSSHVSRLNRQMITNRISPVTTPIPMEMKVAEICPRWLQTYLAGRESQEEEQLFWDWLMARMTAEKMPPRKPWMPKRKKMPLDQQGLLPIFFQAMLNNTCRIPAPVPKSSDSKGLQMQVELQPMMTPPAMGAVMISRNSNFPLMSKLNPTAATTAAEMQKRVLMPALVQMKRVPGMSMLRTGKNTQMKAAPTRARVALNLWETQLTWLLRMSLCLVQASRMAIIVPAKPANSKMQVLPPTPTEKRERICLLSSQRIVPIMMITVASRGPALPPIPAKMMLIERAHLNAPTIVLPRVSTPASDVSAFSSERYVEIWVLDQSVLATCTLAFDQNPLTSTYHCTTPATITKVKPNPDHSMLRTQEKQRPKPAYNPPYLLGRAGPHLLLRTVRCRQR